MCNFAILSPSELIGVIGLLLTGFGVAIAWITWINPFRRVRWFMLTQPSKWEERIYPGDSESTQWVFMPNPSFRIHWGRKLVDDFGNPGEGWLPKVPKGIKNCSFQVSIIANGIRLKDFVL